MTVVSVSGVWKSFHDRPKIGIKEMLLGKKSPNYGRFSRAWALQDVSFTVDFGKAFGIIGENGTGKSTLLSLLLGTISPDLGKIVIPARVASLLEIGAGFHPELTGKENIFLYGSILGMTIAEVRIKFEKIIEFSELGTAIHNPVRTYSSGMITRLGFSIIIHAPAKVLLIDEILAVGDARFQQKCLSRLIQFKEDGGTLIIVSHDALTLAHICDEGICLRGGVVVKQGTIQEVLEYYGVTASREERLLPPSAVTMMDSA